MITIRIYFLDGSWFDFIEPEGFSFGVFAKQLRSDHYILCEQFYIPEGVVKSIFRVASDQLSQIEIKTAAPNAPTTGTKQ